MSTEKKQWAIHEDWAVVIAGFIIIIASISGLQSPVPQYNWSSFSDLSTKVFSGPNLLKIFYQFLYINMIAIIVSWITRRSIQKTITILPILYILTIIALILTGSDQAKALNLEAVIFSLAIGLLIDNLFKLPQSIRSALNGELFVKIGLVLLGTSIIFKDIVKEGALGLIQALIVVLSVWYFAYWVCKKLKIDNELTMMLSSAVSICGVSAAIATAGAIKGDSKKLSYVISLVLITAIPMMIFMPVIAKYLGLSQQVTGAWLGGSIDTTGAVAAAGTLVGDIALKTSTIVKFSQNLLLGIAAFAISLYWTYTKKDNNNGVIEKPTLKIIWERFPKFVLGFVATSLIFSFLLSPETVGTVKTSLKAVQGLWFALAFTSIGLETNFRDLFNSESRKPLYAFLIAQGFNILITLLVAYLLFK